MNKLFIHIYENDLYCLYGDEAPRRRLKKEINPATIIWLMHQSFEGMRIISFGAIDWADTTIHPFPTLLKAILWNHIDYALINPDLDLGDDPLITLANKYDSTKALFVRQLPTHPEYFQKNKQEYSVLLHLHKSLEARLSIFESKDHEDWKLWAQKRAPALFQRGEDNFLFEFHKLRITCAEVSENCRKSSYQWISAHSPRKRKTRK